MTILGTMNRFQKEKLISPPSWLLDNIHYMGQMGSVAYGANTDNSDMDIWGWCIPRIDDVFPHLRGEIPGFGNQIQKFEQWSEHHCKDPSTPKEYDFCVYSIVKFFQLAMDASPNMIDLLYLPTRCIMHASPIAQLVRDKRKLFLSKKAYNTFRGYAFAQFSKIEGGANRSNPKRAKDIETFGFSTKFLYHVFRLALQAEQILNEYDLDLERDSEIYKAVRRGEYTLEYAKEWFQQKEKSLELDYAKSNIPHKPDQDAIKTLLLQCLEQHYGSLSKAAGYNKPDNTIKMIDELQAVMDKYR